MKTQKWLWLSVWITLTVGVCLAVVALNGFYTTMRMMQIGGSAVTTPLEHMEASWANMWWGLAFLGYGAIMGIGLRVMRNMGMLSTPNTDEATVASSPR